MSTTEICHSDKLVYTSTKVVVAMSDGRGEQGGRSPWILKFDISYYILSKKGCFLSFEREKRNLTTFVSSRTMSLASYGKISYCPPSGKNPSDAHVCSKKPWYGVSCKCMRRYSHLIPFHNVGE